MTLKMHHPDPMTFVVKATGRSLTFAGGASVPTFAGFDGETHEVELLDSEEAELSSHPCFHDPAKGPLPPPALKEPAGPGAGDVATSTSSSTATKTKTTKGKSE